MMKSIKNLKIIELRSLKKSKAMKKMNGIMMKTLNLPQKDNIKERFLHKLVIAILQGKPQRLMSQENSKSNNQFIKHLDNQ